MSAVLDSFTQVLVLTTVAWLIVMVGTGAALAHRLGWHAGYGALLGLLPVPFLGWLIVYATCRRRGTAAGTAHRGSTLASAATAPTNVVNDWSRP